MKSIIFILVLILLGNGIFSPSMSMEILQFTLEDAIRLGLEQSPELVSGEIQIELAEITLKQAKAQYRPRLGLNLSYGIELDDDAKIRTGDITGGLFVNYDIFGGIYRRANLERAQAFYQSALYQQKQGEIQVSATIIKNYFEILKSLHRLELSEKSVNAAKHYYRQTQIRFESGLADSTELEYAEIMLQEAESGLMISKNFHQQLKSEFRRLLGLKSDLEFEFIPGEMKRIPLKQLDEYITHGLEYRTDLLLSEQNRRLAELTLKYARLGRLPKLNLFTTGNIPIQSTGNARFVLTPNIYWQIYDAGDSRYQIELAELNLYSAETAYYNFRNKIALEIRKAYHNVIESEQIFQLANKKLQWAENQFRKGEIRYQAGEISDYEYQRLKEELEKAGSARLDSYYDLILSQANLQQNAGLDLFEFDLK